MVQQMIKKRIIKKYPNRRLYDTELSSYIKLNDIRKLVLKNIEFEILDSKTNEDVTNYILLQIINEQESSQVPIFTKEILLNVIKLYENPMQKVAKQFLGDFFNQSFEHGRNMFDLYSGYIENFRKK